MLHLPDDRDPVGIIEQQNASRLQDLVPVRLGRMLESPFAFYRGTAAVMAADLRDSADSGFEVVACGDAHISNFGFYASPERDLVFDLNDFDEASLAPWEWDVRRLAVSVHLAGRQVGLTEEQCRESTVQACQGYVDTLDRVRQMTAVDRYFLRADDSLVAQELGKAGRKTVRRATSKARGRTSEQVLQKLTTTTDDGAVRIDDQPPLLRHVDHADGTELADLFADYRGTVREDVAFLLGQFQHVDHALRVVGVGSVGTRCYLIALQGPSGEVLFLQAKEAQQSVLVSHGGRAPRLPGHDELAITSQGQRVVAAQRVLQATSDPFLGWIVGWAGEHGAEGRTRVDYYWRQFRDMKGSIDPSTLDAAQLPRYGALCAALLARAHAQSPTIDAIGGYLGRSGRFAEAAATWAAGYADVAERDAESLAVAVRAGRLPAERGV